MVTFLEQQGIEGATVLEVGGGVGAIQIELLKRGLRTNLWPHTTQLTERDAREQLQKAAKKMDALRDRLNAITLT